MSNPTPTTLRDLLQDHRMEWHKQVERLNEDSINEAEWAVIRRETIDQTTRQIKEREVIEL